MLTYRSPGPISRRINLTQLLAEDFDPEWVTNKLVLLGTTAYTSRDKFFTPYTLRPDSYQMSGVEIHAQMTSQFLTAVLDDRSLPWAWPDRAEVLWIVVWAGGGGLLGGYSRSWLTYAVSLTAIVGTAALLFTIHGWVPVVAPGLSLTLASAGWQVYRRYRRSR
ncbi:MAG: CHASE2 domain-containing protein [Pseudomonadota bacterium]